MSVRIRRMCIRLCMLFLLRHRGYSMRLVRNYIKILAEGEQRFFGSRKWILCFPVLGTLYA
jgi:hypothetical protein